MSQNILIGKTLDGRYNLIDVIGKGSSGFVYKAEQLKFNRPVAVKVLHAHLLDNEEAVKRFQREAQAVSKLRHPNLIEIIDFGITEDQQPYMVTELMEGYALSQILESGKTLKHEQTSRVFQQLCSALEIAHSNQIIHRDIKPSNIIVSKSKEGGIQAKLVDFGMVKFLNQEDSAQLTQIGQIKGSPQFISPEQCTGKEIDHQSDIYSLGCVLYMTLCGKPPFEGEDIADLLFKHVKEEPTPLTDFKVNAELSNIVKKAMEKSKSDRYQSMKEFREALESSSSSNQIINAPRQQERLESPVAEKVVIDMAPPQVAETAGKQSRSVMHDGERGSNKLLTRDQYWSVDAKDSEVFREMRKRQTEELSDRILRSVKSSFVGDQTMAWIQNPKEEIDFESDESNMSLCQLSMAKLMDRLFDEFQRYAYQFNQTEENREFVISCARPQTVQGPEPIYSGHLQNSIWALKVTGDSSAIKLTFVQTQYLYRQELLSPAVILELKVESFESGPAWSISQEPLYEAQIPLLAKKIFARLLRVSRGEVSENDVLVFNTKVESSEDGDIEKGLTSEKQDPRDVITYSFISILESIDDELLSLRAEGMKTMQSGGIDAVAPVMEKTKSYSDFREKVADLAKLWAKMLSD